MSSDCPTKPRVACVTSGGGNSSFLEGVWTMRIGTGLATLVVLSAMATSALAQPGAGAGGRGRGGFGGTQSAVMLAGIAAVQKDLGVTEDQIAKLKTLGEEARKELTEGGGGDIAGLRDLRDLPEAERRAKLEEFAAKRAEIAKKVVAKYKPKLAEVLDAKQVERLQQIALQVAGAQAYSDPDVVKTLKLSKEQQDKVAAVVKDFSDKQREMFTAGGGGAGRSEEAMTKMRELGTARDKDLVAVLTADQKEQLAKLKGKEFDTASLRGGPGGRPPGGAGGSPGAGRPGAEGRPKTEDK